MAGRALVDGRAAVGRVLSHMWCYVEVTHDGHEVSCIKSLVRPHCDALGARRITHNHVLRGRALDHAGHLSEFGLDHEAVAVLRHDVARIGELGLFAFTLPGKLGFGVRAGGVRLIAARLAMKIAFAVAPGGRLSAPFREVTFCASYKCHCFGVKGSRLSWFRG